MASELPWKVLAERLGHRGFVHHEFFLSEGDAHNMLVGQTIKVARPSGEQKCSWWWGEFGECVQAIVESEGDARATACIELLDAVGWEASR